MAPPKRPWFRFYVEAVNDRKLRRLPPETRWLFVACLAAARQSCIPGYLLVSERDPMDVDDLMDFAYMTRKQVTEGISSLLDAGVIDVDPDLGAWFLPSWNDRQFESDNSAERMAKHRRSDADVTPPETETETDTDSPLSPPVDNVFPILATPVVEPHPFPPFWELYPARNGKKLEKAKAEQQWGKLSTAEREAAMVGVANYAASGVMPKDAFRWLRDHLWLEWLEAPEPTPAPEPAGFEALRSFMGGVS